jgi:plastocyanin
MYRRLVIPIALVAACAIGGCGKSSTPTTPTTPTAPTGSTVSIVSGASTKTTTAYNPDPITIAKGMTVTWTNNDTAVHTSTSDPGMAVTWSSGNIAPGATFSQTFTTSGTFSYHCTIHPGMVGTVTVQ